MEKVIDYETESGDRMVSIAEVQAAYKTAVLKTEDKFYRPTLEAFLTELTKPPEPRLRDDCPVMYEHHGLRNCTDLVTNLPSTAVNIRPLIPTDQVMDAVVESLNEAAVLGDLGDEILNNLSAKITAYTTEPSDE